MIGILGISLREYKVLFLIEIIVSELLFVARLKKRSFFWLRVIISLVVMFCYAFFVPIVNNTSDWSIVLFLSIFILSLAAIMFCYEDALWNVLFCGLAAYIVQHMAYIFFNALRDVVCYIFNMTIVFDPYSDTVSEVTGLNTIIIVSTYLIAYFLIYWYAHYFYASKISTHDDLRLGQTRFVMLAGVVVLVAIIFSLISQYNPLQDDTSVWIERGYGLLSCFMALQLQFSQLSEREAKESLSAVQMILQEEKKQYAMIKRNMDTINIKYHDLKHLVALFRARSDLAEGELSKVEESVAEWDSIVKTGNDALDLVLTDKSIAAKEKGVVLSCIADGEILDFIRPSDIFSLFGNALDNAINAVAYEEEDKRVVSLSVKKVNEIKIIHIENYYSGKLVFVSGLPKTTTGDEMYHGYGMLSIKTIAERYGGIVSIEAKDDIFNLNIIFTSEAT